MPRDATSVPGKAPGCPAREGAGQQRSERLRARREAAGLAQVSGWVPKERRPHARGVLAALARGANHLPPDPEQVAALEAAHADAAAARVAEAAARAALKDAEERERVLAAKLEAALIENELAWKAGRQAEAAALARAEVAERARDTTMGEPRTAEAATAQAQAEAERLRRMPGLDSGLDEDEERRLRVRRFLEADKASALDNMREFCVVAENTGNPLFLWKALSTYFDANWAHETLGLGRLEMPQPFRTYLAIVLKRITDLSEGLDYRQTPEPFGELPRGWESVEVARKRRRTLDVAEATKLALHAFGLRRDGWNAFERAVTLGGQDLDAVTQELYRTIGDMGDGEAVEALLEDHAVTKAAQRGRKPMLKEDRGLRKRIKASHDAHRPK